MGEFSFGDAMKDFMKKSRLGSGVKALQVNDVWEAIMGKTIAKYTDRLEIVNQTLFIHTNVGPLRQELMYQKEKIIQRVNEAMGDRVVTAVVIK